MALVGLVMWVYYLFVLPVDPTNISGEWILFAGGSFMLWMLLKVMRGDFDNNPDSVLHNRDRDVDQ